jgi:hypothetical protein
VSAFVPATRMVHTQVVMKASEQESSRRMMLSGLCAAVIATAGESLVYNPQLKTDCILKF